MIFTGLKRKSNQLFFNKKLSRLLDNLKSDKHEVVKNLLILSEDNEISLELSKQLSVALNIESNQVTQLIYQKRRSNDKDREFYFSPDDFGWFGKIKSEHLLRILTKKYDLLINYSKIDNLYCTLLLLQCKSGFRVGHATADNRFYDLMINCSTDDSITFTNELKKYLAILNKLL